MILSRIFSPLFCYSFLSYFLVFSLIAFLPSAHASGAVMKRQQMKSKGAQKHLPQQSMPRPMPRVNTTVDVSVVRDIVSLEDVLKSLETSSQAWTLIIDQEAKEAVVDRFIKIYRRQGVIINKTVGHYTRVIDAMSQDSKEMLVQPFVRVFRVVAILEYDFDNGQDKDGLAFKILGSREAVRQNKERLGIK